MILPNPAFRLSVSCPRGPQELANQEGWLGQVAPDAKIDWAGQPENLRGGSTIGFSGGKGARSLSPTRLLLDSVKYQLTPGFAQRGCPVSCCFLLQNKSLAFYIFRPRRSRMRIVSIFDVLLVRSVNKRLYHRMG